MRRPSAPAVSRLAPGASGDARGFTLLEVMVALAILAMGLLAVSELVGASLRNQVRAAHLETATLLARGKLAAAEDEFERKGFRDFAQVDEGTFEKEGHPEVRFKVETVKPQLPPGPEGLLKLLGGGSDLGALLGMPSSGDKTGTQAAASDPKQAAMLAMINQQFTALSEQVKKGVREVRLTVSWPEGKKDESFTVVTHLVVLNPKENP